MSEKVDLLQENSYGWQKVLLIIEMQPTQFYVANYASTSSEKTPYRLKTFF